MRKLKKEIISLVVAVLVVGGLLGALAWQRNRDAAPEEEPPAPATSTQIIQRTEAELVSATFQTPYETNVMVPLETEAGSREWAWEGADYVLDNTNARHKVRGAFNLFANQVVHENAAEAGIDLGDFGFHPPYMTVTSQFEDGTTTILHLGSLTADHLARFAIVEGEPGLYTVANLSADRLFWGLEDLICRLLPVWTIEEIQYALIAQQGQEPVEFRIEEHHDFEGVYWLVMQQPFPGREVFGMSLDHHIFEPLAPFVLGDVVSVHPTNLTPYGLDNPSMEFIYQAPHGEAHLLFGDVFMRDVNGASTQFIYVKFADRPHVFEALHEPVSALFDINPLQFIDRFIALMNIQDVERMEVLTPGGDFDIVINHIEDSTDIEPTINNAPVDDSEFRLIYRLAIGIGIDSEIASVTPPATPLYTIRYILHEGEDTVLTFYDYNEHFLSVSVDGQDIWFITNRRNFDMFITRLNEIVAG